MSSKSEDVLLQVSQVRYKKGDGTLYLMSERLAWILEHKDTVSVSHRYADIKLQKISPEGKPKIQLQVVLHDNTTSTFQFVSRQGTAAAIKERNKVKDLLVSLLPKFKRKVNKELEEKNRLLSENPGLLQLYKELVITEVVTSEEFWANHATAYTNKYDHTTQKIGISGAFLAGIKPQTDGCNGLRYNITADVMESIFRTYPAVRQKYRESVPNKMTESLFWTKFFQSHYFHRDRIHAGTKDIFTECAKIDEQVLSKEMAESLEDPLVDITSFHDVNLGDGYGSLADSKSSTQNIAHQNMIKRFNQHSIMVLKSWRAAGTSDNQQNKLGGIVNGTSSNNSSPVSRKTAATDSLESPEISNKKKKIREKITYDDLEEAQTSKSVPQRLNLSKIERYLQGPLTSDDGVGTSEMDPHMFRDAVRRVKDEARSWPLHSNNHIIVPPSTAVATLGELTPGGALMKAHLDDSLAQVVTDQLAMEVKVLYISTSELLRHFWACFPPTSPALEAKAQHMYNALRKFHNARIKPFENKIMLDYTPLSQQLTGHLNQLYKTAYNKYEVWQARRKALGVR